jgi:hypothetical protein
VCHSRVVVSATAACTARGAPREAVLRRSAPRPEITECGLLGGMWEELQLQGACCRGRRTQRQLRVKAVGSANSAALLVQGRASKGWLQASARVQTTSGCGVQASRSI